MKIIRVYGSAAHQVRKSLVREAAAYFLNLLLPLKRKIRISIHLESGLIADQGVFGECYHIGKSPSKYKIRLDSGMPDFMLIKTLAHEFVHIRQFDCSELVLTQGCSKWQGVSYSEEQFKPTKEPWEVEPRALELPMTKEFFRSHT
jgi:hypothetical protein